MAIGFHASLHVPGEGQERKVLRLQFAMRAKDGRTLSRNVAQDDGLGAAKPESFPGSTPMGCSCCTEFFFLRLAYSFVLQAFCCA